MELQGLLHTLPKASLHAVLRVQIMEQKIIERSLGLADTESGMH